MLRNKEITRILTIVFLLLSTKPAFSGLNVKTYQELKETDEVILKAHIYGIGNGYQWSNAVLANRGDKKFYCSPDNLALNEENFVDIIDAKITKMKKAGKNVDEFLIEGVLFFGLVESFPCQK